MTDCRECGSKVAELDIFCPFCGISLEPIAGPDKAEDAFASTIVMPEAAAKAASDPAPESAASRNDDPVIADVEPQKDPSVTPTVAKGNEHRTEEYPPDESSKEDENRPLNEEASTATGAAIARELEVAEIGEPEIVEEVEEEVVEAGDVSQAVETEDDSAELAAEAVAGDQIGDFPLQDTATAIREEDEYIDEVVVEEVDLALDRLSPALTSDVEIPEDLAAGSTAGEVVDLVGGAVDQVVDVEGSAGSDDVPLEAAAGQLPGSLETRLGSSEETPAELENAASTEVTAGTSGGEIAGGEGGSFTTPNIGAESTDGRRSGLKPLAEGILLANRYKIAKKIGGGGMGAVYLATDLNLGNTQRAVKEMVQSHIEEDQQAKAIDDFRRESMILSTLDHPSIPTIYDYFYDEVESRFYLVMKYISGGDLASRLRAVPEGRIDERTVTEWALQIIDVLDYLHSLPTTIVYRDLKPSNVMIDGNTGRIMLIDFGIARSINQNQEKGVTAVGTMGYAPPELFSGQVEPRSDIYSLGSTMFHLLTGADPQNNPLLIFDFQKNPRPRQINPRLSDQMEKILMRAVEYSADARFSSAADMRRALQEHLDHLLTGNVTYGISESPAAVSLAFQTVFCGFCGQRIVATDLFCAFCGSKQPIAQHGVHSEIYSRSSTTARLVIDGTSELDSPAFSLEKSENLVGRRDPMSNIFPEVDLSRYDPQTKISRRHARIWRDGKEFMVEDLGSSNGTLLLTRASDTLRLTPHSPHPLANGDRIRIGDTTLQFIVS